jgi:hypothetical protein
VGKILFEKPGAKLLSKSRACDWCHVMMSLPVNSKVTPTKLGIPLPGGHACLPVRSETQLVNGTLQGVAGLLRILKGNGSLGGESIHMKDCINSVLESSSGRPPIPSENLLTGFSVLAASGGGQPEAKLNKPLALPFLMHSEC